LAWFSAGIMTVFDADVISYGRVIQSQAAGFGVSIEAGCNGVEAVLILIAGMVAFPSLVLPQQKFEVKVANFVGPQHFQSQWLVKWGETLEKKSNGRLSFKHFPGAQMGPTPKHFDFARDGTAEMSFFLHGSHFI
jgi:hypothetical protein